MDETLPENDAPVDWDSLHPSLTECQKAQLAGLAELLREWNSRINLVSRKDIEQIETHHIGHGLLMGQFISWAPRARVLDVGTGGGLPGLPLAILFPEVSFFLCDSVEKKVRAVREMVEALKLRNVEVVHKRAETLESRWDFVIGRAVAALPEFLGWITKNLRPGGTGEFPHGVLYLKGSRYVEELEGLGVEPCRVYTLSDRSVDPYFAEKFLIHLKAEDLLKVPVLVEPAKPPPKKRKAFRGRGRR